MDRLVQERCNCSALVMELRFSFDIFSIGSLVLEQSYDLPSVSKISMKGMGKLTGIKSCAYFVGRIVYISPSVQAFKHPPGTPNKHRNIN